MSVRRSVQALSDADPGLYERAWLASINLVGVVVVLAVVFDSSLVLGRGQSGVFRRALYPLVPPAVTLGVAVALGTRRGVLLSAGALVFYVVLLVAVGTARASFVSAPEYAVVAVVGTAATIALGYGVARQLRS